MPPDTGDTLAPLLAILVPGDGTWPSAPGAGVTADDIRTQASAAAFSWIETLAGADANRLAAVQAAEPEMFDAMLRAVYRAYYTAPRVQPLVAALANSAPREALPHFDPALVARVVASQAGKWRNVP